MSYQRPKVDLATAERNRPKLGTPFGDEKVGDCALPSCQGRIARADHFIATLAGTLYHRGCWMQVRCKDLSQSTPKTLRHTAKAPAHLAKLGQR